MQQAAAQDAACTAVVHECCGAVRSRKAQRQALPDNRQTGDTCHTSRSRERSCAGEKTENRAKQRIQAAQPPPWSTRHTTASNIIIGWNLHEYVGQLLLLLPQRVPLIVTTRTRPRQTRHAKRGTPNEARQTRRGLSGGRGVAQFPPSWQAEGGT